MGKNCVRIPGFTSSSHSLPSPSAFQSTTLSFCKCTLTSHIVSGYHVPSDPARAKQRLIEAGTDFTVPDGEPALESDDCLTYYVVTLVFEVR